MYRRRFFAIALALAGISAVVTGCGGGSSEITTRTFTSNTISLGSSRTGKLTLNIKSDGTASGQLLLDDPSRVKSRTIYPAVLGGTNSNNAFEVTGTFTINGSPIVVTVSGNLPANTVTNGGTITILLEGTTYTGTFIGIQPTPTPIPGPVGTPAPTPGPGQ
jgi:hypothetical protein